MKKITYILYSGLLTFLLVALAFAQGKIYEGPDDPAGDISAERVGYMNGNRILLYFENNTQLADWPTEGTSKWPNDYSGTRMLDNVSVLIGNQLYLTQDSIPVTDLFEVEQLAAKGEIDTIYFVQGSGFWPLAMDENYDGTVEWGLYPVPGYFNETQDYPAMSNKPDSWPTQGWPSVNQTTIWPGEWFGRYGRGLVSADQETYIVANDAQDMEYVVRRNDPLERLITIGPRYHPRPGVKIGDINPNVTIQKGLPWGGLGLRVAVRGYQWNNPEAKDIIFWEYHISNISDYDLPTCGFGYWTDNSIGGDTGNDSEEGYFNKLLDLAYVWESTGLGEGGLVPGVRGVAFLESPGRPYDGIDNDDDGLVDEKRDNQAGQIIGPTDGIQDISKFLSFYHKEMDDLKEHYEGDEDQDWEDGYDKNGNGTYAYLNEYGEWMVEEGEYPGDDVGLDGVGPYDLNYNGFDEGECNHMPDFIEGVGCEPNFAFTDVSESDMVGLTSYALFDNAQWKEYQYFLNQDKILWDVMDSHEFDTYHYAGGSISLYEIFASSRFPFYAGRTERISMAIMFTRDDLATLRSGDHSAPKMFRLKETAQAIYDRDYRFSQSPILPILKATAGDGKVILTWDDLSDKRTHEPMLQNINDFEGYKLYRATDKLFSDAAVITDGRGDIQANKPIFQCDKIDNISGYSDYGVETLGYSFYLGDETGLTHYYVDEDVQNGVTYYYALTAYDYGIPDLDRAPAENNIVIELDESETIVRLGQNVKVVTPGAKAAGYVPPSIKIDETATSASLRDRVITPEIMDANMVKGNHKYEVDFSVDTLGHLRVPLDYRHPMDAYFTTTGFNVYDITDNKKLIYTENPRDGFTANNLLYDYAGESWGFNKNSDIKTEIVDGFQLTFDLSTNVDSAEINLDESGWLEGNAPIVIATGKETKYFPWAYDIVFTGEEQSYSTKTERVLQIYDTEGTRLYLRNALLDQSYHFYVINKLSIDSTGNYEKLDLVTYDLNGSGSFEWAEDVILAGHIKLRRGIWYWAGTVFSIDFRNITDETNLPQANDVYHVEMKRPFSELDKFVFTVNPDNELDKKNLKSAMDSIKVVPNPYIATNAMETAVANRFLNQRRRIMFTHVPADCIIRIFTSSGVLVDRIEVVNEPSNGAVHWDLLSKEGLEIAAGMYIYQVESNVTGDKKIGKFAVIK